MIEVIYREDVSEDSIREPRNVKQIGSVDPKYRIYMEDTVLSCIRKTVAAENEVHFGLLLGELKRAAGTTYLFIRGMAKAGRKKGENENENENGSIGRWGSRTPKTAGKMIKYPAGKEKEEEKQKLNSAKRGEEKHEEGNRRVCGTGSGAVALERLTLDRQRGSESEVNHRTPDQAGASECDENHQISDRKRQPENRGENRARIVRSVTKNSGEDQISDSQSGAGSEESCQAPDRHPVQENEEIPRAEFPDGSDCEREEDEPAPAPLIVFDGETWTRLYEDINRWFPDMEILGWYASFPFLNVAEFELCREIHYTHFSGADKVLFLCDRIEREENFYRPDGAELRETEGYFTFFEKNDAMVAYQQENEAPDEAGTTTQTGEEQKSILRHGTVGEAPRRKWNISAASVLLTAALLAAVLIVNQYNSRLKAENGGSSDGGTAEEETFQVQALAVDGQVMDSSADGKENGDGNASDGRSGEERTSAGESGDENVSGGGNGEEDASAGGSGDGSASVEGSEKESAAGGESGDGSASVEGRGDENVSGGRDGEESTSAEGSGDGSSSGADTGEKNADGEGTGLRTESESSEAATDGNTSGASSENSENPQESETIQTGSRVAARYYTVKNGETLYSICMDVYKTSAMVEIVRALNGIGEDYVIQEGQKILLP